MDAANNMAHYIDDDIITSRHLLAPKDTVRSRGNRSTGLTKRKVAVTKTVEETTKTEEPPSPKPSFKANKEAIRARYVKAPRKRKLPKSPFGIKPSKDLELAWHKVPVVSRILVTGVLLTVLSLTTPFWAYVRSYSVSHATFGLWHFCIGSACWSIHDNLIHGRDVPLWYMVSQMTFTIGVVCATLAMFVVTSNHVGNQVKLSPTTNSTMVMMLVVGVLQMSTGLYTFVSYFEDVSFMYEYSEDVEEVDLYGSFWLGVLGTALILIAAMILFFDEEIMPYPEKMMFLHGAYPPAYQPASPPPPGYYPPEYYQPEYNQPEYYQPEYYQPDAYQPDAYPAQYPPGEYNANYDGESYPDNALFNDMPQWDQYVTPPIVSQSEVPCGLKPEVSFPRRKRSDYRDDYLKKST